MDNLIYATLLFLYVVLLWGIWALVHGGTREMPALAESQITLAEWPAVVKAQKEKQEAAEQARYSKILDQAGDKRATLEKQKEAVDYAKANWLITARMVTDSDGKYDHRKVEAAADTLARTSREFHATERTIAGNVK